MTARLTQHAIARAGERLSWNAFTLQRMADLALHSGIRHADTTGRLNRFLTKLFCEHGTANNLRIYGHHIYIFANDTLVTVFDLPNEFKKVVAKICATTAVVFSGPSTRATPANAANSENAVAGPESLSIPADGQSTASPLPRGEGQGEGQTSSSPRLCGSNPPN